MERGPVCRAQAFKTFLQFMTPYSLSRRNEDRLFQVGFIEKQKDSLETAFSNQIFDRLRFQRIKNMAVSNSRSTPHPISERFLFLEL